MDYYFWTIMKKKIERNRTLFFPKEIFSEILKHTCAWNNKEKNNLVLTSYGFYAQIQLPRKLLTLLVDSIVLGDQNKAEKIIKNSPDLLLSSINIIDYSGRAFHIPPLKYLLWALDTYMIKRIIEVLQDTTKGEEIRKKLLQQYDDFEKENGVTYHFEENNIRKKCTEKHFDFTFKRDPYLYVREKQRRFPAHVAQHFCDTDNNFYSSTFQLKNFKRSLTTYFCNRKFSWFYATGSGFSVSGLKSLPIVVSNLSKLEEIWMAEALERLYKQRKKDFTALREILATPFPTKNNNISS